jgi:ABC-2 type transport system ATP-binding protein
MIEVNNLVKKFGNFTAVKGISFTAEPGQVTGFLGPKSQATTSLTKVWKCVSTWGICPKVSRFIAI